MKRFCAILSVCLMGWMAQGCEAGSGCVGEDCDWPLEPTGHGCDYEDENYWPGDSFPASDGCNTCTCEEGGAVVCTELACDPSDVSDASDTSDASDPTDTSDPSDETDASDATQPQDDPDPTDAEVTCEMDGETYVSGESWPAGDGCNTCGCFDDGSVGCTEMACQSCYGATTESGCDSIGMCRWLTPGCAEGEEIAIPTGCYSQEDCSANEPCPDDLVCTDVVYNPCPPMPDGTSCDACGGYISACIEADDESCELFCEFGFKTDSSGHEYCECRESDACVGLFPEPHRDPDGGECIQFPTICDIPTGWVECGGDPL